MKINFIFDIETEELSREELEGYLTDSDSAEDCTDEELIALLNEDEEALELLAEERIVSNLIRIELEPSK